MSAFLPASEKSSSALSAGVGSMVISRRYQDTSSCVVRSTATSSPNLRSTRGSTYYPVPALEPRVRVQEVHRTEIGGEGGTKFGPMIGFPSRWTEIGDRGDESGAGGGRNMRNRESAANTLGSYTPVPVGRTRTGTLLPHLAPASHFMRTERLPGGPPVCKNAHHDLPMGRANAAWTQCESVLLFRMSDRDRSRI